MALQTKSIIGDGSRGHHRFTLTITENSTNVANNTSSISWSFVLSPIQNGWDWKYQNTVPVTYTITINGVNYTGNIMEYDYPDGRATVTVTSGSTLISHNSDGSKTLDFSFSVSSINSSVLPGSASASGSMALTAIPRFATITSAPNFSDGENPTITYSNPAGEAVTSLKACISLTTADADIAYRDIPKTGTSYTFNLTDAERAVLRNATTGSNSRTVYFIVWTVMGGVHYTDEIAKTFSIANGNPIVSGSVVDTNATTVSLTGDSDILVKYFSDAKCTMTAEAQKGATLDMDTYVITNGRSAEYGTEGIFENVEDNTFTFSVTDSRGNTGRTTVTPTMVEYVKLTCNLGYDKPDGDGKMTVTCYGNVFTGSFGAVDNAITTAQYRYRTQNGTFGAWTNMTVEEGDGSYLASAYLTGLDYRTTYEFECKVKDKLMEVSSTSGLVKSIPVFHWSENDFVFEVPVTFNGGFEMPATIGDDNGDMTITGDLRLKGDGNYGNKLRFGDGDYCYISEPTDDDMLIHADKITLDASSGVYLGGYAIPIVRYGTWTPSLNSAAVSSYTTQYGWYSKVNQAVTVGFCIKATCKSGYDSTAISITGLPFTPMFTATGGGMCSGVYVSAGFNFQCFAAETSATITTRVQSCNHTSQTNLSTSASGCFYRNSGGEITLSGTITFMSNS